MSYKFTRLFVDNTIISANGHALHRLVRYPSTEGLEYTRAGSGKSQYYICAGRGTSEETYIVIADTVDNVFVTEIGHSAFKDSNIIKIVIPDNVYKISDSAFANCSRLEKIAFEGSSTLVSILQSAFENCTLLSSISVPDTVTSIGTWAFRACTNLNRVSFGKNPRLDTISRGAFLGCTNLAGIEIPASVTAIGGEVFKDCTNLTEVTMHEGITSIGYDAFKNCTGLEELVIPDSVTVIESGAFRHCSSLQSITVGSGVTKVGNYTFGNCRGLTHLELPGTCKSLGNMGAFGGCTNLSSLTVSTEAIANSHIDKLGIHFASADEYIDDEGEEDGGDEAEPIENYNVYVPESLKTLILADGSLTIPTEMFSECKYIESVTIPDSVTSIKGWAFEYCSNLAHVVIGRGVTSIETQAFYQCRKLTSINYAGTVAEWNAISKASSWKEYVPADRVQCYDGDVILK